MAQQTERERIVYTANTAKRECPNVLLRFQVRPDTPVVTIQCVTVREGGGAIVKPFEYGSATEFYFPWAEIAESLNSGKPLEVGSCPVCGSVRR